MTAAARRGAAGTGARGGPLVMLVLLVAGWSAARAVWWENPFAPPLPQSAREGLPAQPPPRAPQSPFAASGLVDPAPSVLADSAIAALFPAAITAASPRPAERGGGDGGLRPLAGRPGQSLAPRPAPPLPPLPPLPQAPRQALPNGLIGPVLTPAAPFAGGGSRPLAPFLPPPLPARRALPATGGRWSVEGWAFWRQGSDAAPVSQGRVPIYGASQTGAVLQYRLAPGTARDPRAYVRAYRALVRRGESEAALGVSARPFGRVPLRLAGEVRYTDAAFTNEFRPAAFAVTEFAPVALPLGVRLEAYGQAGWVGGAGATPFADGQASITREVGAVAARTDNALRLTLGAAAWGGAQEDAQRVDVGPTLRLDLRISKVPARLSVDWRERVAGDASPGSGLAVTLSTQF